MKDVSHFHLLPVWGGATCDGDFQQFQWQEALPKKTAE